MLITWESIVLAGSVLGALFVIGGAIFKVHKWYLRQNEQDEELKKIKQHHEDDVNRFDEENTLICYALSACLDGLIQLGCNHTVPDAKNRLDKYLNKRAHHK